MSLAVVIKQVDTPVDAFALAGRPATAYVQLAAEALAPVMTVTVSSMSQIAPQVEAWTRSGVDQVLLLESNRPLLTAGSLRGLLERSAAGVTSLALTGAGEQTAALCLPVDSLAHHVTVTAADSGMAQMARAVGASYVAADDPQACMALDSLKALVVAERILCQRLCDQWLDVGVHIVDPSTTYLDSTVMIGAGTRISPNTHLVGETLIGECAEVGPNTIVRDSTIGDRCRVFASVVEDAVMDAESSIGPFGHLRKGAHLCQGAHMGNFGEVKNSVLGPNSKMGHFGYLGDATVGRDVNIGAGTITCNYDGTQKHRTIIRDGAFIGSDAMLVAPVEIGQNARIGAGSVVTRNVPDGAVAYGVPARVKRGSAGEEEESGGIAD